MFIKFSFINFNIS